jgi:hypothetical protein
MHTSINKGLFTIDGNVLTSGGAGNLAKGQLALITDKSVSGGRKVVSDFAGLSKNTPLQIRVGRNSLPSGLRSNYAPYYQTSWFTPESIVSIKANFPKNQFQKFDELIVGYDGINANTALNIPVGKSSVIDITLDGKAIEVFAGEKEHTIKFRFTREEGQTNQEVVQKLVERIQEFKLPRSQKPVSDFVEVGVVDSTNPNLAGTSYTFSTISVVDDGSSNILADIQAQYPTYTVVRTGRSGLTSTYTILHPSTVTLTNYSAVVTEAYVKGCASCLAGYSAITGGIVYHITLEDDGTDLSTTVDNVAGFVAGTVAKVGQSDGRGVYQVVTDDAMTDAEIATFIAQSATTATAEITNLGSVETVCEKSATTAYTWTAGNSCFVSTEQYSIQLKDNECGESRLTELQKAYPNLVIEAGVPTGVATQTVTVSTDVALVIVVNGVTYTTADAGTVAQTATAFFTQHAAAILADTGTVVTNPSSAVLLFTDSAEGFPTITSAAQTVGVKDFVTTATAGGCQRVYSTYVTTNLVCDECSDIFLQPFKSEAPSPFKQTAWQKLEGVFNTNALMGIKLKGKPFNVLPTEVTRDQIPFYETSTRIKSVAGGYREMDYLNIAPAYNFEELFSIKRLSRAVDRDALGVMFYPFEEMSRAHFLGETRERDNIFAKYNAGEESVLKFNSQYITFDVTWQDTKLSQGIGGRSNITHTETIVVELGYHDAIETLINKLAAKAGVEVAVPTAN